MIQEADAKSLLRKHRGVDSWFLSIAGMNLYRGCAHNCVYCDGRAEKYQVAGEFGRDIVVKRNALELLKKELDPKRKRVPWPRGYMIVGGGVGDAYQPIEEKCRLTRGALEVLREVGQPVHVLSKSSLLERDLDLLQSINTQTRAIVSMSFSSVDDELARVFEPGTSLPSQRLQTLARAKAAGLATGMFLMPVIPGISDSPEQIAAAVQAAKTVGVDFVVFGGMTLKPGRQWDYFFKVLDRVQPELKAIYTGLYRDAVWGNASAAYYAKISAAFAQAAKLHHMPKRVPPGLYRDRISGQDLVLVMLQHLDYLLQLEGRPSPYGFAARSLARLEKPIAQWEGPLQQIKGIGAATEKVIREILKTGSSTYLESLL
jgi:DNA repair photolyase